MAPSALFRVVGFASVRARSKSIPISSIRLTVSSSFRATYHGLLRARARAKRSLLSTPKNTASDAVARAGARVLRGGAYKPRTSPYAFQGMGIEGLKLFRAAGDETNMATVSEVMELGQIEKMLEYVDILQVGARNMQNYNLLSALGQIRKPILLKRGMSATIQEWLLAADYIMAGGNYDVILCERGIRTFETYTRNTLDISAIPVIDKLSHLPIIADPSHAVGRRDKVMPLARAIVAAGGDGVLIEVHHDPEKAVCDGPQSLYPDQFARLMDELRIIVPAVGRNI
jgi:3-deoxy-7-phosphoheptulonate synthase